MTIPDFIYHLRSSYKALGESMWEKWKCDLPTTELTNDRWERAKRLGFGKGTSIYDNSYVYGDVKVGENTWIGPLTLLDGSGGLVIGGNCSIASGVQIYSHDTVKWAISGGVAQYEKSPTKIGDCCYIGPQSVIGKGVKIGNHCIVGACSFVDKDVPDYTVVAGCPAKVIGKVSDAS